MEATGAEIHDRRAGEIRQASRPGVLWGGDAVTGKRRAYNEANDPSYNCNCESVNYQPDGVEQLLSNAFGLWWSTANTTQRTKCHWNHSITCPSISMEHLTSRDREGAVACIGNTAS